MVKLQEAENQIVIDYEVLRSATERFGPADCSHSKRIKQCWTTPRLVAADAAFYSARNERQRKHKGVKRSAFQSLDKSPSASASRRSVGPQRQKWRPDARTHQRGQAATRLNRWPDTRATPEWSVGSARRGRDNLINIGRAMEKQSVP